MASCAQTPIVTEDYRVDYRDIHYSGNNMQLIHIHSDGQETNRFLSKEQADYMNTIWNNSEWYPGATKTFCSYRFETDSTTIRYSPSAGVFNDDTNQRYTRVSDELRDYINAFLPVYVNDEEDARVAQIAVSYPVYHNVGEIANAATNIYVGTVTDISYEIVDMKTGKVDNSPESESTSRMLYTIYTVSVTSSLKGKNPSEIKISRLGGVVNCQESEQIEKLQESGLLSKYFGIPVVSDTVQVHLGNEYLFCTHRVGGDFDLVINLTQFAHEINSDEANLIKKQVQ